MYLLICCLVLSLLNGSVCVHTYVIVHATFTSVEDLENDELVYLEWKMDAE